MDTHVLDKAAQHIFMLDGQTDIKDLGWDYLSSKIHAVYADGGQLSIWEVLPVYSDGKYVEFKEITGYIRLGMYSLMGDPRYGYLLWFNIEKEDTYPPGVRFNLLNRQVADPGRIYFFLPMIMNIKHNM